MNSIKLDKLQTDFLEAFFARESSFFLSGGAALVGFYFGHRETHDLDLFTLENDIENGFRIVNDVARDLDATVDSVQTSPDFRRLLVKRDGESIVVDLIREYVFQTSPQKRLVNQVRIDTPDEIFANKLCALISRSEIRDLVDVRQLENSGLSLEDALDAAEKKDSGLTPAQLAWVLSQIRLSDQSELPGDVSATELDQYLQTMIDRLRIMAMPK